MESENYNLVSNCKNTFIVKRIFQVLLMWFLLGCGSQKQKLDCSKYDGQELVINHSVEDMDLRESRFTRYLLNQENYYNELIELETNQVMDTLTVKFFALGGNSHLECLAITEKDKKLNILNLESNYLTEITIRRYVYKILNEEQLALGKINFRHIDHE